MLAEPAIQTLEDAPDQPIPEEEVKRLHEVDQYRMLDSGQDLRFDHIANLTKKLLRAPCVLISIADRDRQWWKASIGLTQTPVPPAVSFTRKVVQTKCLLSVKDAQSDPVFCRNPFVTGPPGVRSYLGAPITNMRGHTIGALGAFRPDPWMPTPDEVDLISDLAWVVMDACELNRAIDLAVQTAKKLAESEEEYRETFELASIGIAHIGLEGNCLRVNGRLCEMVGYSQTELIRLKLQDITHIDDMELDMGLLFKLLDQEIINYEVEKRLITKAGEIVWMSMNVSLRQEHNGQPLHFITTLHDITDRKNAEEQSDLLVGELNHRIKNTIATVASVATQSAKFSSTIDEFRETFGDRVEAIASAHRLLNNNRWHWVYLHDLIAEQAKFDASTEAASIRVEGPEIKIQAQVALYLGLILHELATNSRKHGSLARDKGYIEIVFDSAIRDGDTYLVLSWAEIGGPSFDGKPKGQGFGTYLIDRGLRIGLQGSVTYVPSARGFKCEFQIPLRERPELDENVPAVRANVTPA